MALPSTSVTAPRTAGDPSRFLVWPSNSGSGTRTWTAYVRPSLINSAGTLLSFSLSLLALREMALTLRDIDDLTPSRCVPPSPVRIPFANDVPYSVYWSALHRSAMST